VDNSLRLARFERLTSREFAYWLLFFALFDRLFAGESPLVAMSQAYF